MSSLPQPDHVPRHGRAASREERRQVPVRVTSNVDDPLAALHAPAASPRAPPLPPPADRERVLSPVRSEASPLAPPHDGRGIDMPSKDFSFLQDAAAYHVLPASNVAPPFLNASSVPPVSSPVDSLLASGHYRLAAIAAARNIVQAAAPSDFETLFHLLHIRLACLCLISEHALAAQESKVLGDLNSAFYRHPLTNAHLVPWDLRVLIVRLAALGYGEWRKGVMGYYELARECRENILKVESEEDKKLWRNRLRDCGIRVANVLVEMGDLEGAGRHLATLSSPENGSESQEDREVLIMEALVWLRVGDIRAARASLTLASSKAPDALVDGTLEALIQLANSEYAAAVTSFEALHEQFPADAMVTQNLAVVRLYTGHISTARSLLTELAESSAPFHALTFNLSTIYELCTERNRDRKVALAERLASRKGDGSVGWEIATADFKL